MTGQIQKGLYEHFKGRRYEVVDVAMHSETLEPMVIYKALYKGDFPDGTLWVRPLNMFKQDVSVDGKLIPRFRYLGAQVGAARRVAPTVEGTRPVEKI